MQTIRQAVGQSRSESAEARVGSRTYKAGVTVAILGLAVSMMWLAWPEQNKVSDLRLKTVRRVVESGKPEVFFRVEGGGGHRVMITDVHQVVGGVWQTPLWGTKAPALKDPAGGRQEFGVICPSNLFVWKATTWKLQASVVVEAGTVWRVREGMRVIWASRPRYRWGFTFARSLLNRKVFIPARQQSIESDLITNPTSGP